MYQSCPFHNSHPLALSGPVVNVLPRLGRCYKQQRRVTVHAEEPKVTREYREDDDSLVGGPASQPTEKNPKSMYIDEMPEVSHQSFDVNENLLTRLLEHNV